MGGRQGSLCGGRKGGQAGVTVWGGGRAHCREGRYLLVFNLAISKGTKQRLSARYEKYEFHC